jgi:chromosome segregation ATPase
MGTIFGFMKNLGKQKMGDAGRSLTEAIVSWDPEAASQAEIETMIDDLDKITREAATARLTFQKEKQEADAARSNYDRHLQAAEILNQKMETAKADGNQADEQSVSASLEKLLKQLETLRPEVEREAQEAEEAKVVMGQLEEFAGVAAAKLKTARSQLEAGKREMQRAEMDKKRAQERAAQAERLAGLKQETSNLGVALSAMNRQAEKAKAETAAASMKATLLAPEKSGEDKNIDEALKAVSGEKTEPQGSFADRLAALKK